MINRLIALHNGRRRSLQLHLVWMRGLAATPFSWDPEKEATPKGAPTIAITVHLPESAVVNIHAKVGSTLLEVASYWAASY